MFERGATQAEVARQLGVSRQISMLWRRAWEKGGIDALRGAGRAGRKPRLSAEQLSRVERALLRGPQARGYATDLWTLPRIRDVIREFTGVHYHSGHVWKLMRKIGWSLQKPTTRARERDEQAIRHWVQETWPRIKKTPHAKARRSSSSTKAGSRSARPSVGRGRPGAKRRS
jgi:transposase